MNDGKIAWKKKKARRLGKLQNIALILPNMEFRLGTLSSGGTHNPNLVVNTDSEQVIEADFDGSRKPRIVYTSGALENTSTNPACWGIRERVCQVLEGGSEAFKKREEKYSLPPN